MSNKQYVPIPRYCKRPPYGYIAEDDLLVPDQTLLELLDRTLQFIDFKAFPSYKQAADYITYESGRPITYEGIRLIHRLRKHPVLYGQEDYRGNLEEPPFRDSDSPVTEETTETRDSPVGSLS